MNLDDIERVAVLGAGNMGHGITEVVALAGYEVTMRDIKKEFVEDGYEQIKWSVEKLADKDRIDESAETVLDRISTEVDLQSAVTDADLVIEAAPEKMDLKHDIFSDLDEMTDDSAILASNTSSLSITEIATATDREDKVLGLHFFNPPVMMDLVEVIHGEKTRGETAELAYEFVESLGKTPIHVRKDVNGFVVNRVLLPFMYEPAWMLSNGETEIRQADAAMVYECGYPMGPFELADMTGIDVGYHVLDEAGREAPPVMEEKVDAGDVGKKSGQGFYDYENGGADYEPEDGEDFDTLRVEARMINEATWLVGQDVATPEAIDTGMKLGAGFPEGICRRADKLGLDTVLEKLEELQERTGHDRFEPSDQLVAWVEEGRTGKDAGAGFYEYASGGGEREYEYLKVNRTDEGVLEIELDRTERMNAISPDLADEIEHLLTHANNEEIRCVTFRGGGDRAFSAGADITSFTNMKPTDMMDFTSMWETVAEYERPTIALIDGHCLGGGFELALACDLRICTPDAQFGFPEIKLGLIPGAGGTQRLQDVLGVTRTKEMIFRSRKIDGGTAEDWGVVNHAVDPENFDDFAEDFVDDIAQGPPIALKMAKKVIDEGRDASRDAGITMEREAFGLLLSTDDVVEGVAAFQSDDEPDFKGE